MFQSISKKFTQELQEQRLLQKADTELYEYGFQQGFQIIFNIITTIVIGILFQMVWESFLFLFTYIPLRSFAGGYHAKTSSLCYILLVCMLVMGFIMIRFLITDNLLVYIICSIINTIIIYILSPIGTLTKPLNKIEREIYQKKTRKIVLLEMILIMLFAYLSFVNIVKVLAMAVSMAGIMVLLGYKYSVDQ